jgi:hypothetical protein
MWVKVMNCEYKEKTILYFYGELSGGAAGLEKHLGGCASCAADLAVLKSLSAGFSAFKPEPPGLRAFDLVQAARGAPLVERLMSGFSRFALAGAVTGVFLLAFQILAPKAGTTGWGELDLRLDSVQYDIYSLRDDMFQSSAADFDYGYADIENQKEQAVEEV